LDGRTLTQILITHRHRDHAGLARRLAEATGASIAAHPASESQSNFKTVMAGLMDESFESDLPVDASLKDQMTLDTELGPITTLYTPGHTSDHCCFWLECQDTLFTGDHVMGWSTTVIAPPEGDMSAYMSALRRLEGLQPKRLVPTHGLPIEEGGDFLQALIDHRQGREDQVIRALETGAKTVSDMVASLYPELTPALVPAAKLSLLGHLDALLTEGRATLDGTEPLDHPFSLP
ncbi:MAG: MBL fold metallo-hydrolase, partial [Sphaerospermopsis sp. SIO1G1]|nr:MBL fold metallo-hydrolase [Sphaerospermopsis sp. SIO1G1]